MKLLALALDRPQDPIDLRALTKTLPPEERERTLVAVRENERLGPASKAHEYLGAEVTA